MLPTISCPRGPVVYAHLRHVGVGAVALFLIGALIPVHAQVPDSLTLESREPPEEKEAPYVPTPRTAVRRMLALADVDEGDVVYDLGSGDGRIVIIAAEEFGARGVGVEIDRNLVERARFKARQAGVANRVTFRRGDLFDADLGDATVVTLYLWPHMNERLRPKLQSELAAGARVVSYDFGIEGWAADTTLVIETDSAGERRHALHLWTIDP